MMQRLRFLFSALGVLPLCALAGPCHTENISLAAISERIDTLAARGQFDEAELAACIAALRALDDAKAAQAADLREARRLIDHGDAVAASELLSTLPEQLAEPALHERDLLRAELAMSQGRYADVESLAREIIASLPDDDTRNGLRARLLVSRALSQRRDAAATNTAASEVQSYAEHHFGKNSDEVAAAQVELAAAARLSGDHGTSISALERAIAHERAAHAANPRILARALVMQAQSRKLVGDYARAAQDYETATTYLREHPEPLPLQLAAAVHGLANLHRDNEQIPRSLDEYVEAEALMARAYGPQSLQLSAVQNNHANALGLLERYDEALVHYQAALSIGETQQQSGNPALGAPIGNIALIHLWKKDFKHAEDGFRRNVELYKDTPSAGEVGTLFPRMGLAASLWGEGQIADAFETAVRAEDERYYALALTAAHLAEDSAIHFQESQRPSLDLVLAIAYATGDAKHVARAWELAMRAHGQITMLTAARLALARGAHDPHLKQAYATWLTAQTHRDELRLAALAGKPDKAKLQNADAAVERSERALGESSATLLSALRPDMSTLAAVRAALPRNATLVSYASGNMRVPEEYALRRSMQRARDIYAFVAMPGMPPRLLRLGGEDEIAHQVKVWRELAGRPDSARAALDTAGKSLRAAIYDPLGLPAREASIVVVPDGELHRLAYAALPADDGTFLVDRGLRFHTLNHESELLKPLLKQDTASVFALSDPRGQETSIDAQRSACAQLDAIGALPGSKREVAAIHALLPSTATWSELSGAAATEDALRARLPGHAVLHLATHALSLAADCLAGSRGAGFAPRKASQDSDDAPAALGALIVAPGTGDGLLSESEIAALDLSSVRWAVLSACDTGLGASRAYEGAFGLRRAFALAGVRSVIMSLWRVDDTATADWMTALYRARWKDRADTLSAVYAAQRDTLRARREAKQSDHPYYWAAFVAAGDWR